MKTDLATKPILGAIAIGLFANAVTPLLRPLGVRAAGDSLTCKGTLDASSFGANYPGGYDVKVTCEP